MTRELWDQAAGSFDQEPDHGLSEGTVRDAWRDLLVSALPPAPAHVADLGCGTGTLTRLLTDEGYTVDGLDFSPEMLKRARSKVPEATFTVGDANSPPLPAATYDVVLSRHVLWAMDDPRAAFARWVALLRPPGSIALIEGRWSTGGGLRAEQIERIVLTAREEVSITPLPDAVYWGKEITDERYLAVSHR